MEYEKSTYYNQSQNSHSFDANDVFNLARDKALQIQPNFCVDDKFESAMHALSLYFSEDGRFEEKNFGNLKKGLFIVGNVGVGKTLLMKAFQEIYPQYRSRFKIVSTISICDTFQSEGVESLDFFKSNTSARDAICFDDIGVEQIPAIYMGNKKNVMQEIIQNRYQYQNIFSFRNTHFTSNLDGNGLENLYGTRVRSRLREMCNFIILPGTDRRK